jgi:hypothetical protein
MRQAFPPKMMGSRRVPEKHTGKSAPTPVLVEVLYWSGVDLSQGYAAISWKSFYFLEESRVFSYLPSRWCVRRRRAVPFRELLPGSLGWFRALALPNSLLQLMRRVDRLEKIKKIRFLGIPVFPPGAPFLHI